MFLNAPCAGLTPYGDGSNADRYALVRLFEFRRRPQCFTLAGEIGRFCRLDPVTYRCSFG